ncbi:hypothetical protein LZ32DRAFT_310031 [Colletotrichum eremochloae]|nr:hypothetical protein LZ32DRAFT_310031 [Colletotrichum eremochloae]
MAKSTGFQNSLPTFKNSAIYSPQLEELALLKQQPGTSPRQSSPHNRVSQESVHTQRRKFLGGRGSLSSLGSSPTSWSDKGRDGRGKVVIGKPPLSPPPRAFPRLWANTRAPLRPDQQPPQPTAQTYTGRQRSRERGFEKWWQREEDVRHCQRARTRLSPQACRRIILACQLYQVTTDH